MRKLFLLITAFCFLLSPEAFSAMKDSDFLELCKTASLEEITAALDDGANVNSDAIITAAWLNQHPEVISALIKAGADVNSTDGRGQTALMFAVNANLNPAISKVLMDNGANVNARNQAGTTVLMYAVGGEYAEVLDSLDDIYRRRNMIISLINSGADIDIANELGLTALMYAAKSLNTGAIQILLDAGATPTLKDKEGKMAIDLIDEYVPDEYEEDLYDAALKSEEYKVLKENSLSLEEKDSIAFLELCKKGTAQQVKSGIAAGNKPKAKDREGNTALMAGVENSDAEISRILIRAGADMNAKNKYGMTALMFAALKASSQIVKNLISAGADINLTNTYGLAAITYSNWNPDPQILKIFIDAKSDVNNESIYGETALMYATSTEKHSLDKVTTLIKAGANINAVEKAMGKTVLMWAAQYTSDPNVIIALLKAGADATVKNPDRFGGSRAIDFALLNNKLAGTEAIQMLKIMSKSKIDAEFIELCRKNDLAGIRAAIDAGVNVNVRDKDNDKTPLMYAVSAEAVDILVKAGANINFKDRKGRNALLSQISNENPSPNIIEALIRHGADVNELFPNRVFSVDGGMSFMLAIAFNKLKISMLDVGDGTLTALMIAASNRFQNQEVVKILLKAGADVNAKTADGMTALMINFLGSPIIAKTLIDAGADVNARDSRGMTSLMWLAIFDKSAYGINVLANAGADPKIKDNKGLTALDYSTSGTDAYKALQAALGVYDDAKFISILQNGTLDEINEAIRTGANLNLRDMYGYTPLVYAVKRADHEIIAALVKAGANVNGVHHESGGWCSSIIHAIRDGDAEVIKFLVSLGADVNLKVGDTYPIIVDASRRGTLKTLETLIELGANVHVKDKYNETALICAVAEGYIDKVSALIKAGANVNVKDRLGNQLLIKAINYSGYGSNTEVILALIKAGASVNVKDKNGNTPLIEAISHYKTSKIEIISALIKAGADVNTKGKNGNTPLIEATSRSYANIEIISALMNAGADVNAKNFKGETPLKNAEYRHEIREALIRAGAK